jgi:hypothetical protein
VVGASFVVGVQAAAIFSTGNFSRLSIFRSENVNALAPEPRILFGGPLVRSSVAWPRLPR